MSKPNPLQIGETVYHRDVCQHRESLVVKGVTETEVLLEGDYSGGTHNVKHRCWLPIKGVSRIYDHAFKEDALKRIKRMNRKEMIYVIEHLAGAIKYNEEFK